MTSNIMGWDIGGAHLKTAVLTDSGVVLQVLQQPCPLWKGLPELEHAVQRILQQIPGQAAVHVLTMTGELVDLFSSREEGVKNILATMLQCLSGQEIRVFSMSKGLLDVDQISSVDYSGIASANWLASVTYAASKVDNALFIDIGSTTTDILLIENARVNAQGLSDYQRLCSAELLYTGIVRTPVMAIADQLVFEGKQVGLMAEYFATMADVYRVTGQLNVSHDQADTADGAEKTISASARRLSRMIGCDFYASELSRWQAFAEVLRSRQLDNITSACTKQLKRASFAQPPVFIGAGIGRFLVQPLAAQLGADYRDFSALFDAELEQQSLTIADCAPAVAVAALF